MTLEEFQEKMAPMHAKMARVIAASLYEPTALERALSDGVPRKRYRRSFRIWLSDQFIEAASWLRCYDITDE